MKKQLIVAFDSAIAYYDKALDRANTEEWFEYAKEYDFPMTFVKEVLSGVVDTANKYAESLNDELYAFEQFAVVPFEEFI